MTVKLGWCTVLADFNNDGWKDIFTANSHVNDRIGDFQAIAQAEQQSLRRRRGRFRDASDASDWECRCHIALGVADFNVTAVSTWSF